MNRLKTEQYIKSLVPKFEQYINRNAFRDSFGFGYDGREYVLCSPQNFPFHIRKYYKKRVLSLLGNKFEYRYKIYC